MDKKTLKTKGNILVELIIKGYTENFLNIFLIFFKQRFFPNFLKLGSSHMILNKYTLLRSSFVNKSSREQIEKRIYKKKITLLFSEYDFKSFYSSLSSLNFKGISIKISKYYFKDKNNVIDKKDAEYKNILNSKNFNCLWNKLSLNTRNALLKRGSSKDINKVFTVVSSKNSLSKHISLKFLKNKSLKKNRLKKGLFKVFFKKPNLSETKSFDKSFSIFKNKKLKHFLKLDKSFIKKTPSVFSLLYSYNFNSSFRLNKSNLYNKDCIIKNFSRKEKSKLYNKNLLLNSISLYRNFFIWSFFTNNRRKSDYRNSLSKKIIIDKFNIYFKLILGLKIGPFNSRYNIFFKNNFDFISNYDKNFYIFSKISNKVNLKYLNKLLNIRSLYFKNSNNEKFSSVLNIVKNYKKKDVISINPWLIRRYITKTLDLKNKRNILKIYEKNSLIKSLNNLVYFKSKVLYFFLVWYNISLKGASKRKKFHLKKRLKYVLRRNWGILWRFKSKNRIFFRHKKKKNYWKKFNRNFKNNYQKKRLKQKKLKNKRYKLKYRKKKLKNKRYLSVFFKK